MVCRWRFWRQLPLSVLIGIFQGLLTAYFNIPAFIVTLGGLLAWRGAIKGISQSETVPIADATFKQIGQGYIDPRIGWVLAAVAILAILYFAIGRAKAEKEYDLGEGNIGKEMLKSLLPIGGVVLFIFVMNSYAGVPIPVLILLAVALVGFFITNNTTFGRYLYAIGGNADAARLSGINNKANIVKVFAFLGRIDRNCGFDLYGASRQCRARCRSFEGTRRDCGVRDRRRVSDGRARNGFRRVSRRVDYGFARQRNVSFKRPRFYAGTDERLDSCLSRRFGYDRTTKLRNDSFRQINLPETFNLNFRIVNCGFSEKTTNSSLILNSAGKAVKLPT